MAIKIDGKRLTPTAAAKRIVLGSLPKNLAVDVYLDPGTRIGPTERTKLQEALAKQTARIRRILGVA